MALPTPLQISEAAICLATTDNPTHRSEAEALLKSFRASREPYSICLELLQGNHHAAAKFHAVLAMREALLREWRILDAPQVDKLRDSLLDITTNVVPSNSIPRNVSNQLFYLLGLIFKRMWFRDATLTQTTLLHAIRNLPSSKLQLALLLCKSTVTEFSSAHSTELGVAWEFHVECHRGFELSALLPSFQFVVSTVRSLMNAPNPSTEPNVTSIAMCFQIIEQMLSWEFEENFSSSDLAIRALQLGQQHDPPSRIKPGKGWRSTLIQSPLLSFLFESYTKLRTPKFSKAAAHVRLTILQLASLTGSIFPTDNPGVRLQYLSQLVHGVFSLLKLASDRIPITQHQAELEFAYQEVADLCLVVNRCIRTFGVQDVTSIKEAPHMFGRLSKLTCWIMKLSLSMSTDIDTRASEAFDDLIQTWVYIISEIEVHLSFVPKRVIQLVQSSTPQIVQTYIDTRLQVAAEEIQATHELQEQFQGQDTEQLENIGLIARVNAAPSLKQLCQGLIQRTQLLNELAEQMRQHNITVPPDRLKLMLLNEELFYFLHLLGFVLTDSGDGEKPLVPQSLMALSNQCSGRENKFDPVCAAASAVFEFASLYVRLADSPLKVELTSPLLEGLVLWLLGRWAHTYLMPSEADYMLISPSLWRTYGEGTVGSTKALEFVVSHILFVLTRWYDDASLVDKACTALYKVICNAKVARYIHKCDAWKKLLSFFTAPDSPIGQYGAEPLQVLTQSLCQSAIGLAQGRESSDAQRIWFKQVVTMVGQRFNRVVQDTHFGTNFAHPHTIRQLLASLAMMRGVGGVSGMHVFDMAFTFLESFFDKFLRLVQLYKAYPRVVTAILQLVCSMAESEVRFMSRIQSASFMSFVLRLVRVYGKYSSERLAWFQSRQKQHGDELKHSVDVNGSDNSDEDDDFVDISTVLRILDHVNSKDLLDFSDDDGKATEFASDAALAGLGILLPHITEQNMFMFPTVTELYFDLLEDVITTHPSKFGRIGNDERKQLMQALVFAIQHHSADVVRCGLQALRALAEYHLACMRDSVATPFQADLSNFMHGLFSTLLFQRVSPDTLDDFAHTLLPMIIISHQGFVQAAQTMASECSNDASIREKVTQCFQRLINTNGVKQDLTRPNKKRFRQNFRVFISTIRGLIQSK
jgi:exportin-4